MRLLFGISAVFPGRGLSLVMAGFISPVHLQERCFQTLVFQNVYKKYTTAITGVLSSANNSAIMSNM